MTGAQLKEARQLAGWTQARTAAGLGVTQAYLSMMEQGRRAVSARLAARVVSLLKASPTALPLVSDEDFPQAGDFDRALGALGCPGFSCPRRGKKWNPAEVLFRALDQPELDSRIVEALPWVVFAFPDLDWEWLLPQVKVYDRQNRLGFVVGLAKEVGKRSRAGEQLRALEEVETSLERSRLANEDTLCHDSMSEEERKRLRHVQPASARHWNLLTELTVEELAWADLDRSSHDTPSSGDWAMRWKRLLAWGPWANGS